MPIGLGIGSVHATNIVLQSPDRWDYYYQQSMRGRPEPPGAALETTEVIQTFINRIQRSLAVLEEELAAYHPELLITVGGDQREMFDDSNVPSIFMYTGAEAYGFNLERHQEPSDDRRVDFVIDQETSRWLLERLVTREGFDVAVSSELQPFLKPHHGLPHAFVRPGFMIRPRKDLANVMVWVNTYQSPCPSGQRCYDLGRAIARLMREDPRRIALLVSGGLSHDPQGPRAGWYDEPLDRWFLDSLAAGDGLSTAATFHFDSFAMRGGTGEMRAWIVLAGAMDEMGTKATVIDYFGSHKGMGGYGFVYWKHP